MKVKFKPPRVQEMKEAAAQIRNRWPYPIVAAIGAGDPDRPYTLSMGIKAGCGLAECMTQSSRGTLLTGGMGGVGLNIFAGVTRYRISRSFHQFFVLIPEHESFKIRGFEEYIPEFQEAEGYSNLAALTDTSLVKERAGFSLAERRICLAHTADMALCLNGTLGTLDEASLMIQEGKPVITCEESGGISETLQVVKYYMVENRPIEQKYLKKIVDELPPSFDPELIVVTLTVDDAIRAVCDRIAKWKGGSLQ